MQSLRGADCDTDCYLVVAKVRDRNITCVIKSRMRRAGHVVHMGWRRGIHRVCGETCGKDTT